MTVMTERKDETGLEGYFAAARETAPQPGADFLARLTEAALDEQLAQAARRAPAGARAGPGLWRACRQALGGWPGLAGLAAACAAGVWLGVSPPAALDPYWAAWAAGDAGLGQSGLDPINAYDLAMLEG
jgi:hypothetical protein